MASIEEENSTEKASVEEWSQASGALAALEARWWWNSDYVAGTVTYQLMNVIEMKGSRDVHLVWSTLPARVRRECAPRVLRNLYTRSVANESFVAFCLALVSDFHALPQNEQAVHNLASIQPVCTGGTCLGCWLQREHHFSKPMAQQLWGLGLMSDTVHECKNKFAGQVTDDESTVLAMQHVFAATRSELSRHLSVVGVCGIVEGYLYNFHVGGTADLYHDWIIRSRQPKRKAVEQDCLTDS